MQRALVLLGILTLGIVVTLTVADAEDAPPELPKLGDLNQHILDVLATYPTDGTHDYFWPQSGSWAGNARAIRYEGKVLFKGDPKGRCFCCGLTFEVFMQAFEAWCKQVKRPYKLKTYDSAEVKKLKYEWFGSNGDRSTINGAVTKRGLGVRITDWKQAKAGDFIQLWRHSGSGHSVVFLEWKKKGKQIVGLTYWSTQRSTKGIGKRTELFGDKGSAVKRDELYIVRIGDPKPATK